MSATGISEVSAIRLGLIGIATVATVGWWIAVVIQNFTPVSILGLPFVLMMLYYVYKMITEKSTAATWFFVLFVIFINLYCIIEWFAPKFVEWGTLIAVDIWLLISLFLILSGKMEVKGFVKK